MTLSVYQLTQACCIRECYLPLSTSILDTYLPASRIDKLPSLKMMLRHRLDISNDVNPSAKAKSDVAWLRAMGADTNAFVSATLHMPWFEGSKPCFDNYAVKTLTPLLELSGHIEAISPGQYRRTVWSTNPGVWMSLPRAIGSPATHRPIQFLFDLYFATPPVFEGEPVDTGLMPAETRKMLSDCFSALCEVAVNPEHDERFNNDRPLFDAAARCLANLCHSVLPLVALWHIYERLAHTHKAADLEIEIMGLVFRTADIAVRAPALSQDDWRADREPRGMCNQVMEDALSKFAALQGKVNSKSKLGLLPSKPVDYVAIAMELNAVLATSSDLVKTLINGSSWPPEIGPVDDYCTIGQFVMAVRNALSTLLAAHDPGISEIEVAVELSRHYLVDRDTTMAACSNIGDPNTENRKAAVSLRISMLQAIGAALEPYTQFTDGCYVVIIIERLSPLFAAAGQVLAKLREDDFPNRDAAWSRANSACREMNDILLALPPGAASGVATGLLLDGDFWPRAMAETEQLSVVAEQYQLALEAYRAAVSKSGSVTQIAVLQSAMATINSALEALQLQLSEQEAICTTILSRLREALEAQTATAEPAAERTPDVEIADLRSRLEQVELEFFQSIDRERQLEKKLAAAQHALDEVRRPVVAGERTDARRFVDALATSSAARSLSMADVVDLAEVLWPERLQLSVEARDIAASSPFERSVEALHAIYLLSHDYLDALAGPGGEERAKKVFPPAQFALGESESTLSSADHRAERLFTFEGVGQQLCVRHIKIGSSRDPRHCARIHFTVAGGKILLGAAGQHLALPGAK